VGAIMSVVLRRSWTLTRFVAPWVIWMVVRGMWVGLISLPVFWQGVPEHCERLARRWFERIVSNQRFQPEVEEGILAFLAFVAFLTTVLGWVILSHITVWVWRIIW
jgi:hypothetical protein